MDMKALPSMEHTFPIKVKGSNTGLLYEGTFTYRRPNIRVESEIAKTAAILDGGLKTLDADVKDFHFILAHLKHTLTNFPEWWKDSDCGYELYDSNVVTFIDNKCQEFETNWKKKVFTQEEENESEGKSV